MERRMNKFAPPLTPLSFPIVLLVILLATVIFSSASASECFEHDSGSVDNKIAKNKNENENENKNKSESKKDIAQVIKCLTEELESFEKINQDLRVKVYELEQTVFEGFDSNFSEQPEQPEQIIPTFKQAETNLPLAKISSKINKIAAGKISDSTEAIKVFKDSSQ